MEFSHIDRPPVGDITGSIISIITGHPEIDMYAVIKKNEMKYELDTRVIREVIGNINLASPEILIYIRNDIDEGLKEIEFED